MRTRQKAAWMATLTATISVALACTRPSRGSAMADATASPAGASMGAATRAPAPSAPPSETPVTADLPSLPGITPWTRWDEQDARHAASEIARALLVHDASALEKRFALPILVRISQGMETEGKPESTWKKTEKRLGSADDVLREISTYRIPDLSHPPEEGWCSVSTDDSFPHDDADRAVCFHWHDHADVCQIDLLVFAVAQTSGAVQVPRLELRRYCGV